MPLTSNQDELLCEMSEIEEGYCEPDDLLAKVAFELGWVAYSALAKTPNGLPGRGFYLWTGPPEPLCCDELVVYLRDYTPWVPQINRPFGSEWEPGANETCDKIRFRPQLVISLARNCRPVLDDDGATDPKTRNKYGYNLMVDIRTIMCCLQECLSKDIVGGRVWGEDCDSSYYFGRVTTEALAHCTRINIPIFLDMDICCEGGDYIFQAPDPEELDNLITELNATVGLDPEVD